MCQHHAESESVFSYDFRRFASLETPLWFRKNFLFNETIAIFLIPLGRGENGFLFSFKRISHSKTHGRALKAIFYKENLKSKNIWKINIEYVNSISNDSSYLP